MPTQLYLSEDGRYALVTQIGPLTPASIKQARCDSRQLYRSCNRALVDCRQADVSGLRLIDMDTLALEFRQDVPQCRRLAILHPDGVRSPYAHVVNVYILCGLEARLFKDEEPARAWLVRD